jgi:hypothetical protein
MAKIFAIYNKNNSGVLCEEADSFFDIYVRRTEFELELRLEKGTVGALHRPHIAGIVLTFSQLQTSRLQRR